LSEKILHKLDLIAQQENKTRGTIAKDAVRQWINLKQYESTNEMITIPKRFLLNLLESPNEETLEKISENMANLLSDFIKYIFNKPLNNRILKEYSSFISYFFGKKGLKWFNNLDVRVKNDLFIFRGLHDLGEKFSIFFLAFFKKLLSEHFDFDFIAKIEESSPFLINLEFKYKNI